MTIIARRNQPTPLVDTSCPKFGVCPNVPNAVSRRHGAGARILCSIISRYNLKKVQRSATYGCARMYKYEHTLVYPCMYYTNIVQIL